MHTSHLYISLSILLHITIYPSTYHYLSFYISLSILYISLSILLHFEMMIFVC